MLWKDSQGSCDEMKTRIKCPKCGLEVPYDSKVWRCPRCSSALKIDYEVLESGFKKEKLITRCSTMWRYKELIPIKDRNVISLGEGFTGLMRAKFVKDVYIKMEYLSPSGSFKDRGSSVAITHAREVKAKNVVEDSSGNAGSSVALYSSAAHMKCKIYVPKDAPENKKSLIGLLGAEMIEAQSRGEAQRLATSLLNESEYYIGHLWNPFFIEGMKTIAFETAEQLNWGVPDYAIVPIASGSLLLGLHKGFRDLLEIGLTDSIPIMIGVQAEGFAPVYENLINSKVKWERKSLLADALRVSEPPRLNEIIDVLKKEKGEIVVVNDEDIIKSLMIAIKNGFFIEPSSATAIAAYQHLLSEGFFRRGEKILIPLTGSGFKAMEIFHMLKMI